MASIVSSPPRPEHSAPQTSNTQPCVQSAAVSGAIAGDEPGLFTPRANPQPEVSTHDAYAFDRRPLIRYSRRVLLHLSKSPLVALPPNMPEFNMWYGEWTEPHVKKDDHSSSTTSPSSNRHRARREQLDDDTRHMFKSQFPQSSQMGNFRHHSSRLDDKGDRDSHERLRNLADSFDRTRLLNGASRRDTGSHSSRNGTGLSSSTVPSSSRRGDSDTLAGRERREPTRGERSEDWRRGTAERPSEAEADINDSRREKLGDRSHTLRSRSRDIAHGRSDRYREREKGETLRDEDKDGDRAVHGGGRRSPSPVLPSVSSRTDRWIPPRSYDRDENRDRELRMKTNETDDPSRKLDRRNPAGTRDSRRSGRDADREDEKRSDFRNPKDRGRDKDRSRGEDKEPAWMGDYIPDPNDAKGGILGGQRTDGTIDDLQAWKRGMKEKSDSTLFEVPDILSVDTLDDIQIFKRKLKEEQEKQDRAAKDNDTKVASANPPLPPGLPATATNDEKQGQSAALAALLSPLALQLQSTMDVSTDNASLGNASRSQKPNPDSLLSSGLGNATSLSFNRYPDIMPELTSSRDPLAVAGLPTAGRALDEFGLRNEPGTSNPTPPVSDIRISNQQTLSLNGRLTPTNSNPTSTTPSAQSSTYSGEGSPSSGSALPAYAQSKGSRFAKFWDNKPRESATSFNPSQQSQPLAPPSNPMGSSLGTWSSGASLSNDLRVSQPSSPLRQAPAESSALNNLLRNITTPSSVIPPTDRRDFTDRPASRTRPDTDKMQSLLSMLNNQQPRPPSNGQESLSSPFRNVQNGSLNSNLGQSINATQAPPQPLSFSPVGSPDFDRSFVPDGLVPGLRPPRTRDVEQGYVPTLPPTTNNSLSQFLMNEERLNINSQQPFDHIQGRPSPGAFPAQGGIIHPGGRNTTLLNANIGGLGPGSSSNRHSPGLMQTPQHQHQRGIGGSLPQGRPSEFLLNIPSGIGNQTLGALSPNGSLGIGGPVLHNTTLPANVLRSLPLNSMPNGSSQSQMGMANGNTFGNVPNQEHIFQHQHPQVDLQSRLLGNNPHGSLHIGSSLTSRGGSAQSIEPLSQRMLPQPPSHHLQFQQNQPSMMRPQSQAPLQGLPQHQLNSSGGGLPLNLMGLGQPIRPQIPSHNHQIPQPVQHPQLLHHPQLQNPGADFSHQPPFLPQQPLQHNQPPSFSGLQNSGGKSQVQAQQELIALLMGGQTGHVMQ